MALTVISAKYPQHIDPSKTPLAYGDRALPRLVCLNASFVFDIFMFCFEVLNPVLSDITILITMR